MPSLLTPARPSSSPDFYDRYVCGLMAAPALPPVEHSILRTLAVRAAVNGPSEPVRCSFPALAERIGRDLSPGTELSELYNRQVREAYHRVCARGWVRGWREGKGRGYSHLSIVSDHWSNRREPTWPGALGASRCITLQVSPLGPTAERDYHQLLWTVDGDGSRTGTRADWSEWLGISRQHVLRHLQQLTRADVAVTMEELPPERHPGRRGRPAKRYMVTVGGPPRGRMPDGAKRHRQRRRDERIALYEATVPVCRAGAVVYAEGPSGQLVPVPLDPAEEEDLPDFDAPEPAPAPSRAPAPRCPSSTCASMPDDAAGEGERSKSPEGPVVATRPPAEGHDPLDPTADGDEDIYFIDLRTPADAAAAPPAPAPPRADSALPDRLCFPPNEDWDVVFLAQFARLRQPLLVRKVIEEVERRLGQRLPTVTKVERFVRPVLELEALGNKAAIVGALEAALSQASSPVFGDNAAQRFPAWLKAVYDAELRAGGLRDRDSRQLRDVRAQERALDRLLLDDARQERRDVWERKVDRFLAIAAKLGAHDPRAVKYAPRYIKQYATAYARLAAAADDGTFRETTKRTQEVLEMAVAQGITTWEEAALMCAATSRRR